MTDTENTFGGFTLLDDEEEFDVEKIFGGDSDEPAPPPPAPVMAADEKPSVPEQPLPAKTQEAPAEEKQPLELFSAFTSAESDPIPEAAPVNSLAPRPQTQLSLFNKPPVFQYGGAREQITDADMTFEALRVQKAEDFPELEDASAVTWQVRYGDKGKRPAISESGLTWTFDGHKAAPTRNTKSGLCFLFLSALLCRFFLRLRRRLLQRRGRRGGQTLWG